MLRACYFVHNSASLPRIRWYPIRYNRSRIKSSVFTSVLFLLFWFIATPKNTSGGTMTLITSSFLLDLFGVFTAIVAMIYAYYLHTFQYWKRRNVPYFEPSIPWGNFESPSRRTVSIGDNIRKIYREAREKGWKHCGMYTMMNPDYLVLDLDIAKYIMTKDFQYFSDRGVYTNERDDPLSCHLFAISGPKWRNLRTKLTPTFTSGKMKAMFNTLVECGSVLDKYVEEHVDDKSGVNIKNILGNFSTDVIGSCAFGLDCNSFKDQDSPFRRYGTRIFDRSKADNLRQAFCMSCPKMAGFFRLRMVPKDISDFFMNVVRDTVTYREDNNYTRNDFLQLLIDIKNNKEAKANGHKGDGTTLTMEEVAAQSFVFFLAGFETSSTTMTFALFELARHQDLQDKVREEIERVLAKHDGQMTYDSLSELTYMKQVIDEALRMYSPVPFVTRRCIEDYKIPGDNFVIEKGTRILIPISGFHYDEEYYENPTVFDPERFNEENKANRHPYAHLPFGEGPRICIGERFGLMQTKVGLTTILKRFRVTLSKKTKLPLEYSLTSFIPSAKDGIWLNFEKL